MQGKRDLAYLHGSLCGVGSFRTGSRSRIFRPELVQVFILGMYTI